MKKLVVESAIVKENISAIKRKADSAVIIADLSCDAQGLGLLKTAALLRAEGISNFAVYEVEDAEKLREFFTEHQEPATLEKTSSASVAMKAFPNG